MLKKNHVAHFLPLALITGVAMGLLGCSGNDSSLTLGPPLVIVPIEIDKTIEAVEWSENNEVEMASHAYRAVARHSMLATLYSGKSAVFSGFINIIQRAENRSCNAGGSMNVVIVDTACENSSNGVEECTIPDEDGKLVANSDAVITTKEQRAIFYQCQDGTTYGSYFNGPL